MTCDHDDNIKPRQHDEPVQMDPVLLVQRGLALGAQERQLMADVLLLAICDARRKLFDPRFKARDRDAARAWLRNEPGFTAPQCCEVLGIDYEGMMRRLEMEWEAAGEDKKA